MAPARIKPTIVNEAASMAEGGKRMTWNALPAVAVQPVNGRHDQRGQEDPTDDPSQQERQAGYAWLQPVGEGDAQRQRQHRHQREEERPVRSSLRLWLGSVRWKKEDSRVDLVCRAWMPAYSRNHPGLSDVARTCLGQGPRLRRSIIRVSWNVPDELTWPA